MTFVKMGMKGLRVDSQLSLASLRTELDKIKNVMGAELVRASAFWDTIETSDNVFNWTKCDNVVAECQARDLRLVFHIAQTPTWAVPGGSWTPPTTTTQLNQWKSFLQTMAARYGSDVDLYEIWNEPNGASFWTPGTATSTWPGQYAKVLRYAHDGLKAGDPTVTIAAMNTNRGLVSGWLDDVYDALEADVGVPTCQANGYFYDVLSVHPYALTHAPSLAEGSDDIADSWGGSIGRCFLDYRRARDLVHTREGVFKPVYMGEFGYNTDGSSNNGPVADATRATYVPMAFDLIRDDGFVIALTWYAFDQSTSAWDIDGTATGTAFAAVPAAPLAPPDEPDPATSELDPGERRVQPVRQGGQDAIEPIREVEDADSGRFFFTAGNRARYLGRHWRQRGQYAVSQYAFGDAPAVYGSEELSVEADPNIVPYRSVDIGHTRANLIREATITRVGSEKSQKVTSSLYKPGGIKPSIQKDVIVTTDAAALEIAQEYIADFEVAKRRVEAIELVGRDETWEAFFLEIGDRVSVIRHPNGGAPTNTFAAYVEGIEISLDADGEDTCRITVSPA